MLPADDSLPFIELYLNGMSMDVLGGPRDARIWDVAGVDATGLPDGARTFTVIIDASSLMNDIVPHPATAAVEDELVGLIVNDATSSKDPLRSYLFVTRVEIRSEAGYTLASTPDVLVWMNPSHALAAAQAKSDDAASLL